MTISVPQGSAQNSNPPPLAILGQASVAGVGGLVWVGDWLDSTSYTYGMAVTHGGNSWVAVANSLDSAPTAPNPDWQLLALGSHSNAVTTGGTLVAVGAMVQVYTFKGFGPTSDAQGLFLVSGDNGTDGFSELLMVSFEVAAVVYSVTLYGAPAARTYSIVDDALLMSVASGVMNVRVLGIENLGG